MVGQTAGAMPGADLTRRVVEETMTKTNATLFALAAAAVLAGCSDATGTGGAGDGRMQVAAVGDQAAGPSADRAPSGAPSYSTTTAEGTVDFRARVYVQTQAGGWVELTGGAAQEAVVDASGRAGSVVFASSNVEANTYTHVRIVFEQVKATMSGSLQVSSGLLSGTVNVDTQGDGNVSVERTISASVNAGGTARLLIDLNSDTWLNQASASAHTVSEAAFASAVQVTSY
jgi:hypothetical protein